MCGYEKTDGKDDFSRPIMDVEPVYLGMVTSKRSKTSILIDACNRWALTKDKNIESFSVLCEKSKQKPERKVSLNVIGTFGSPLYPVRIRNHGDWMAVGYVDRKGLDILLKRSYSFSRWNDILFEKICVFKIGETWEKVYAYETKKLSSFEILEQEGNVFLGFIENGRFKYINLSVNQISSSGIGGHWVISNGKEFAVCKDFSSRITFINPVTRAWRTCGTAGDYIAQSAVSINGEIYVQGAGGQKRLHEYWDETGKRHIRVYIYNVLQPNIRGITMNKCRFLYHLENAFEKVVPFDDNELINRISEYGIQIQERPELELTYGNASKYIMDKLKIDNAEEIYEKILIDNEYPRTLFYEYIMQLDSDEIQKHIEWLHQCAMYVLGIRKAAQISIVSMMGKGTKSYHAQAFYVLSKELYEMYENTREEEYLQKAVQLLKPAAEYGSLEASRTYNEYLKYRYEGNGDILVFYNLI